MPVSVPVNSVSVSVLLLLPGVGSVVSTGGATVAELLALEHSSETQPSEKSGLAGFLASLGLATRSPVQQKSRHLRELQQERSRLLNIIRNRRSARRLLALWHTVHIPLGLTLFLVAFVHIGATIYYAVLLG